MKQRHFLKRAFSLRVSHRKALLSDSFLKHRTQAEINNGVTAGRTVTAGYKKPPHGMSRTEE
jgi:hypothetical protein